MNCVASEQNNEHELQIFGNEAESYAFGCFVFFFFSFFRSMYFVQSVDDEASMHDDALMRRHWHERIHINVFIFILRIVYNIYPAIRGTICRISIYPNGISFFLYENDPNTSAAADRKPQPTHFMYKIRECHRVTSSTIPSIGCDQLLALKWNVTSAMAHPVRLGFSTTNIVTRTDGRVESINKYEY